MTVLAFKKNLLKRGLSVGIDSGMCFFCLSTVETSNHLLFVGYFGMGWSFALVWKVSFIFLVRKGSLLGICGNGTKYYKKEGIGLYLTKYHLEDLEGQKRAHFQGAQVFVGRIDWRYKILFVKMDPCSLSIVFFRPFSRLRFSTSRMSAI